MDEKKLYKCGDCGLHYEDEQLSKDCYDFCTKYHACSIEITQYSAEHKKIVEGGTYKQQPN